MKYVLFIFFLLPLSAVFADDSSPAQTPPAADAGETEQRPAKPAPVFNWMFQTALGIKSAQTQECVYEGAKQISRLDWIDNAVPFAAFSAALSAFNITARFGLSLSIPVKSGIMEDRDFLIAGSNAVSHYSRHNMCLDKDFTCYAELGYVFKINTFYIFPAAGFCYENRKWSASDGFLQYPIGGGMWTGSEPKENIYGTVINYEQSLWYPALSLCAGYIYNQRFDFALYGSFYPYISAESMDNHFVRSPPVRFYDTITGGLGGKAGVYAAFYLVKEIAFAAALEYETFTSAKGKTSSGTIGIGNGALAVDEGYSAKIERGAFSASFGVKVKAGNLL
ncbi:MAG: omptin family outer membrane protease [Spirochaetaceae bacterium]|nr:omptin family outer membrane protease [Spirochaetaceae bacterium]